MDEVERCTRELSEALRKSKAYEAFRKASSKLKEKPELKAQIDGFRRRNYLVQNSGHGEDLFEEMVKLEKEYEELRKNPLVSEYLVAELHVCRMLQRSSMEIMTAIDLEIQDFAEVIET